MRRELKWIALGIGAVAAVACANNFDKFDFDGPGGSSSTSTTSNGTGATGGTGGSGGGCTGPFDCPDDDNNPCTQPDCLNGVCVPGVMPSGTACTDPDAPDANICDGQGHCVECITSVDCPGGGQCILNECVPASCDDNIVSGDETGIDCGGGTCPDCPNGEGCDDADDCVSGFCDTDQGPTGGGVPAGLCDACTGHADCAGMTDTWCDNGVCTAKNAVGVTCVDNEECLSTFCADAVCCDTACAGTCESCLAANTPQTSDGTCDFYPAGSDPEPECGTDNCDGAGACAVCGDGTQQATETCDDGFTDACGTCNDTCTAAGTGYTCGDLFICAEFEVCDDGFTDACGTCNATCTASGTGSTCGDGVVCWETENCDDNNTDPCGTCSAGCQTAQAGGDCTNGLGCVSPLDCINTCSAGFCAP
ncbi:MAG: hypothetical protein JRI68_25745 [Deltaproteobacteria bacterium]|nr:hypothetical protein [Deltaproteobacteria bacterium]